MMNELPIPHSDSVTQKGKLRAPLSVGIILVVLVGAMWFFLNLNNEKNLGELVHSEAKKYSSLIDGDIRSRLPALQRIVSRWESRGQTPKDEFIFDTEAYIRDLPGFQALGWVDRSFHVRWIVPYIGNEKALGLNLAFEEKRRIALEHARDNRVVTMSPPIDLVQGGKGLIIYFPIYVQDRFDGILSAVLKITPWLDYVFKIKRDVNSFNAMVTINGERVYGQQHASTEISAHWKSFSESRILDHEILVEVVPTEQFFITNRSYIPEMLVVAGLLLAFMVSYMIFLFQKASLVTAVTQAANDQLGSEIQERKKTEHALNEALQLNDTILSDSPVGIVIYDESGKCLSANDAIINIIGGTREQLVALNFYDSESWKKIGLLETVYECLSTGERIRRDVSATSSSGKMITIDCHFVPINVHDEQHLLLMVSDNTETKIIHDQLVQSSKMATLGEMATGVAHELNQPLNVIGMAVHNIQRKLDRNKTDPEYISDKLRKVLKQVDRAKAIIDHMRIFGRKTEEEQQVLSPEGVVRDTLGLIGEQLRLSNIEVKFSTSKNLRRFKGHQVQVEQVLLNLLSNARDALCDWAGDSKCINISLEDAKSDIRIIIENNGNGIDPDVLQRIFEPFYTTKEIGHGTGLGLSISYGIITDLGGTIEAENTKDGVRFTITLPAYDGDAAP